MWWLLAFVAIVFANYAARADDLASALQSPTLTGSLRTGYWNSNRNLDNNLNYTPSSVWLKTASDFESGWYARGQGWLLDERPVDRGSRVLGDLQEGYVGWRNDKIEISLGRRILAWGRADRINPTDVLTARDYTRLFAYDEDQRLGSVVGTASYTFGDMTATALWLPEFRPNIFPVPQNKGFSVRQGTDRLSADQFAVRLNRTGGNFDWALSYLAGVNRNPGARLIGLSPAGVLVDAVYNQVQIWGADFATNSGKYGLRGEMAYSQPHASKGDIFSPRPFVEAVLGVDRNVTSSVNVNLQYFVHHVFSYRDPAFGSSPTIEYIAIKTAMLNNQRVATQHGPALRIGYTTLNDALLIEATGLIFLSDQSFSLRPRVTYAISDRMKFVAGGDIFTGPRDSYFGQLRRNTTFLSEIRYEF